MWRCLGRPRQKNWHHTDLWTRFYDIEPGYQMLSRRIYNLSELELRTINAYIETNLANAFIQPWYSPAAAPILFAQKNDGSQSICIEYPALNKATVKI
jgi:hypothetical protein